ncbi:MULTISPECIES: c-type cytochrome biogenesis protein CcmI [unclassified Mesorhizobium]|jgi:cytochrome c-type biogenesis protein CcmH|uniref:c-type cytochrome biogenesis protein CcmI n=1 Tax=unclassified Mesorhizobium TaxID=325217 RepID=UPI000FCC79F0|nr:MULTISPECIES: c-type cytochrome biogenesis protein CcmI [unclassified Mesorhizobium]RUV48272.1 c-type cytochrome biogenesis protein CcmI [Mesorhizobium sp. M7A.F.Ca.MR.228.00.0.0]RUT87965.1 c-type cytochrome biogenesis protein CcmI [Mesorhizobium sp. M7A.T.Ca.US.000.02.1.1]RUT91973.1 c-type cytochrome biogenesis protein CcmI [Mesorhizobium sp. M7A.T.Ca.US.000.02.2.1]RUU00103.1 c-type cytochrome biogenesis protein CcmI [Mesorhizobium sp. M7A.T.Ca.TU.009.02.1.1]RUV22453.1 c-type cytochrome bi
MLFWVIAAILTLGASLAVLLPLAASAKGASSSGEHDLEVYRDQLSELDRDAARGLIQPAEAAEARAEIARRILRLDNAGTAGGANPGRASITARLVATVAVLAVPLVSWGLYVQLGSPDLPSQPLSERLAKNPADSSVDELVARAEAHLAANPTDGRGWDVLAPVYLRMQRFSDAAGAYRNAIRLDGDSAVRQAGLGEAIASAAGGIVSADAQDAFEAALKLDPANAKASFYLAMALAQEGRAKEATTAWQAMLGRLPPDSPWRGAVEQALAKSGGSDVASSGATNGPDAGDVDAASSMSPQDREAMINTMVAGLDDKLRQNPRDPEGWMRLVRSYVVLGKADQAREALGRAIAVFGADSEQAKKFTAFAASLGLAATE